MMKKDFKIFISEEYDANRTDIFKLIKNGTLFKLTGAHKITFRFRKNEPFNLEFKDRGNIFGTFSEIIPDTRVTLLWNVTGFGRDDEVNTKVTISLIKIYDGATVELHHTGIRNKSVVSIKERAWKEILRDLKKELMARRM